MKSSSPTPTVMAPEDGGRRDRKKTETRRALRHAALRLVAERGFDQVTVEDIAELADVSTRTFFNYFPSKESAVIGADPRKIDAVRTALAARPEGESPLVALRAVFVAYAQMITDELADLGEGREAWIRRFRIVRDDPALRGAYSAHLAALERSLVEVVASRLGTDAELDPYPALVVASVLAATRVASMHWSAGGGADSLVELTAASIDSLASGLVERHPFDHLLHSPPARR
jgi:AcrR family transcriptional regulator